MGRLGDLETWRLGDLETWGWGDLETWRAKRHMSEVFRILNLEFRE